MRWATYGNTSKIGELSYCDTF